MPDHERVDCLYAKSSEAIQARVTDHLISDLESETEDSCCRCDLINCSSCGPIPVVRSWDDRQFFVNFCLHAHCLCVTVIIIDEAQLSTNLTPYK